jgi:4-hydroxy-tetrahydrodipicolinate synthase
MFRAFGSFRVMYMMADVLGLARIEPPRPVLPLPQEVYGRVERALQNVQDASPSVS